MAGGAGGRKSILPRRRDREFPYDRVAHNKSAARTRWPTPFPRTATANLTTPLGPTPSSCALQRDRGAERTVRIRDRSGQQRGQSRFRAALGLGSTIELKTQDNQKRYFNGVMAEARWSGGRRIYIVYQLMLRPWLWLLKRTSDCRIFAKMTPIEIIKQVFSDRGFSDFRDATTGSPPTLEYCVQFRETDFDFVCRLMEEYGIYYFFEHSDGKHTLVLADAKSSHKPVPGLTSLPYNPVGGRRKTRKANLETWSLGRSAQSGVFVLEGLRLQEADREPARQGAKPWRLRPRFHGNVRLSLRLCRHGGRRSGRRESAEVRQVKVEAAQSRDNRRTSMGHAPSLFPGALIPLERHAEAARTSEYLITRCRAISRRAILSLRRRLGARAMSAITRSRQATASSARHSSPEAGDVGFQSALVVGQGQGQEIDVDELGRILVQFYWDRKKKPSRRVRVAQFWAGNNRGALFCLASATKCSCTMKRRSRPADRHRLRLQRKQHRSHEVAGQEERVGHSHAIDTGRQRLQHAAVRRHGRRERVKLRSQKDLMFKALNNEQRDIGPTRPRISGSDETINVGKTDRRWQFHAQRVQTRSRSTSGRKGSR